MMMLRPICISFHRWRDRSETILIIINRALYIETQLNCLLLDVVSGLSGDSVIWRKNDPLVLKETHNRVDDAAIPERSDAEFGGGDNKTICEARIHLEHHV